MEASADRIIPAGFAPSARSSSFLELVGPLYEKGAGADYRIGLFVDRRHVNAKGFCHGALLALLADVHLGRLCGLSGEARFQLVTTNLALAYLSAARLGAWLEAVGQVDRMGKSLGHASGLVLADGEPVLRATGTFHVISGDPVAARAG